MKHLGRINVLGELVGVVLGTIDDFSDTDMSENVCASYDGKENVIRINVERSKSPGQARGNLLHELVHAWFRISGARYFLSTQMPKFSTEALDEVEETLVRMLTPAIDSSFDDLEKILRTGKAHK